MTIIMVVGIILLIAYLSTMVAIAQFKGDTSIANFTWGGGVMLVALYTFFVMSSYLARQILLTTMMVLWAMRLIGFVYIRYTGKDPRFIGWKWQGFKALIINFCWIFGQTIMIAIMGYPVALVNTTSLYGLTILDFIGLSLWLFGYFFEAMSDYQLFTFIQNSANKGRVMRSGLWRYSRHPNYFGEVTMWWGVFLVALSVPYGWSTIVAPLTITFMLLFVTGIPWIEKTMENNPEYQVYKKETSIFIPLPPKK
jgi:steroid 5-alpha reductase family enzyme